MFIGFEVKFTWISLFLHVFCILALAFLRFENKAARHEISNELTISFDVVAANRNIKAKTKKTEAVRKKVLPKAVEQVTKVAVNKVKSQEPALLQKDTKQIKPKISSVKTPEQKVTKTSMISSVADSKSIDQEEDLFDLGEVSPDHPESVKAMEYVKGKIEEHRNFVGLCAKGLDEVEMVFEIGLNSDGSINFAEYLGDNAGNSITDTTRQALICQNLRAIQLAAPFEKLDFAKHKNWQRLRLRFTQN
jgi:hypothetical protein